MFKKSLYITVFAGIFISSCADAPKENYFPHHNSDLVVETAIEYGRLPNGLRYAVMSNETPSNTATLLMRFDTVSYTHLTLPTTPYV